MFTTVLFMLESVAGIDYFNKKNLLYIIQIDPDNTYYIKNVKDICIKLVKTKADRQKQTIYTEIQLAREIDSQFKRP